MNALFRLNLTSIYLYDRKSCAHINQGQHVCNLNKRKLVGATRSLSSDCSQAGESGASQVIGNRSAAHGLSQAARAVRRRAQRGQSDPLERVISQMRDSAQADAANIAALQETEASMAKHGEMLVQQGAQQLALCTQIMHKGRKGWCPGTTTFPSPPRA